MKLILCSRPYNVASWLLRGYLWSKWSHVAIWDDEQGWVYDATLTQGGVKATWYADWQQHYPDCEVRAIEIPDDSLDAARAWLIAQLDKPYDWSAVLGIFFRREAWADDDKWFCSELAEAFRSKFEKPRFRQDTRRITPEHISMTF